jgi:hypothetical protein
VDCRRTHIKDFNAFSQRKRGQPPFNPPPARHTQNAHSENGDAPTMRRETRDELLLGFLAINAMLREELREICHALHSERKYNPNWRQQPRAPKGDPQGGQWIAGRSAQGPREHNAPKQTRLNRTPSGGEQPAAFFDHIDDNPYLWLLSEHGLLPPQPTVADFYNLRFELLESRVSRTAEVALAAGMQPYELVNAIERGSSVMSERAIDSIEGLTSDPGPGGLSIVIREERFREYIARSGVRPEYHRRMFNEIVGLAGFTPTEFEQHKLDVGVGLQFPLMLGGGGPVRTPAQLPAATARLRDPNYVWNVGPTTRGRIIEAALGHNLPSGFRIIDRFSDDGVATSIRSVDLGRITYHRPRALRRRIHGSIDQVAGFRGATFDGAVIRENHIRGRALDLVVPHAGTTAQQQVISAAVRYGESRGVTVNVIIYP